MAETVLLVDDDEHFRALLRTILVGRGYVVLESGSARQATSVVRSCLPNLIVVDGLLPDATGTEWIATLRRAGCATPIVFVSAFWRDARSLRQLRALHLARVFHKPVDVAVLAAAIEEQLTRLREAGIPLRPPTDVGIPLPEPPPRAADTRGLPAPRAAVDAPLPMGRDERKVSARLDYAPAETITGSDPPGRRGRCSP